MRDRTMVEITLEMSEFDLEMLLRASGVEPPWGQVAQDEQQHNDDRYHRGDEEQHQR